MPRLDAPRTTGDGQTTVEGERGAPDLRAPLLGAASWLGGLAALTLPGLVLVPVGVAALVASAALVLGWHRARRSGILWTLLACLVLAAGVATCAGLRVHAVGDNPVTRLARAETSVRVSLTVTSDPVLRTERGPPYVVFRATVDRLSGHGESYRSRVPVVVIADHEWAGVALGSRVDASGRLSAADDHLLAGIVTVRGPPRVSAGPNPLWRASAALRSAIRDAPRAGSDAAEALVPALVDGDQTELPEEVTADFATTGLTHLMAVSGTNLTLVVGFLLTLGRWCGVRGRGHLLVGALGIAGFVLIARTEPSVLRAAAMGAVGLVGMSANGRHNGTRALGLAVVVLLLIEPWLAVSGGFALSVLATAGILFLAPVWRDALASWLPRWAAEAIAVPAAAQVACTPLVAAISGQVSLVAVATNLAAAPAVGPATLLGLSAGLAGLTVPILGGLLGGSVSGALGAGATWCAGWIILVAQRGAALPLPAIEWGTGPVALLALTLGCLLLAWVLPTVLSRPLTASTCCALLSVIVLVPLPTPGWPPTGWVMVACDVGQGDGLVLNAGGGRGVVVDTGPEPRAMDRCLDRLDIGAVPLLVLTHFHADHVDGLPGVLDGRRIGEVDVTSLAAPSENVQAVAEQTDGRAPTRIADFAATRVVGDLTLQVLGPVPGPLSAIGAPGQDGGSEEGSDDGSGPNNASVVLLVETHGIRLLLPGDVEPEAQQSLARAWPELQADVLKVPHHGSRYQDLPWLLGLNARLAIVSVGEDNGYGHPAEETLEPLAAAGLAVYRTDLDGDVAVVVDGSGELRVATRGGSSAG